MRSVARVAFAMARSFPKPPPLSRRAASHAPGASLKSGRIFPRGRAGMVADIAHWIDGKQVAGDGAGSGTVYNPATGEASGRVAFASAALVDRAVQSAKAALAGWAGTPPLRRARILFKFRELLERDRARLAKAITAEHGKVLSDADGEVTRGIEVVEFAAGIPHLMRGDCTEQVVTAIVSWSLRQP